MRASGTETTQAMSCACGATRFLCAGKPIIVAECYCNSCRKAAVALQALPGAPAVAEPSSGTSYVLHRKDRITAVSGMEHLREYRLTPSSKTRRIVATCCNSPMFLDLLHGHWFSIYAQRFAPDETPKIDERTMLSDMPKGFHPPPDARNSRYQSVRFFARLFGAWAAMGFRTPVPDWEARPLDQVKFPDTPD